MYYSFFRFFLRIAVYLYFKKVYIHNLKTVPRKTPLILVSNHGNSFMDAILIAITLKREIHFLARADVFNSFWKRWFLEKINMMPIYRIRDGREDIKKNKSIFNKCKDILENCGAILIFPEGNCLVEKRLRAFKSGFADIALAVQHPDLAIIPIAINYEDPLKIFQKVSLDFSEKLELTAYYHQFKEPKVLKSELMKDTYKSIKTRMIEIEKEENDAFYQTIFRMMNVEDSSDFVKSDMELASILDHLQLNDPKVYQDLKLKATEYNMLVNADNGREELFRKENSFLNHLALAFTSLFWLSGLLINLFPEKITALIVNKIKDQQFKSSVRLVAGCFLFLIYHFFLFLGCVILGSIVYYFFILISSLGYYLSYNKIKRLILRFKAGEYLKIKKKRAELLSTVNLLLSRKKASLPSSLEGFY